MTNYNEPPSSYDVGYGRPPERTRFKPGQSGNPKGRPKGRQHTNNELRAIFESRIPIQDGANRRNVTRLAAVLLKQWERAIRGDQRAAQGVLAVAKMLGFFADARWNDIAPDCGLTRSEIELLSDAELEELIALERYRQRKFEEYRSRQKLN
jgi:hypothetical protein